MIDILRIFEKGIAKELITKYNDPNYFVNLDGSKFKTFKIHLKDIESTNLKFMADYKSVKTNIEQIIMCGLYFEPNFEHNPIYANNNQMNETLKYVFALKDDVASLTVINFEIVKIEKLVHFYTKKYHLTGITRNFHIETKKYYETHAIENSQIHVIILSKIKCLQKEMEEKLGFLKEMLCKHEFMTNFFINYNKELLENIRNKEHLQKQVSKLTRLVEHCSLNEIFAIELQSSRKKLLTAFLLHF